MVVVSASWRLSLPGCASLKEKRSVIRSLKDRLRHRFNVSVAETDLQDVWNSAELSVAIVATDGRFADSVLDKADRLVEDETRAVIVSTTRSFY